jgi:hypothetical protein
MSLNQYEQEQAIRTVYGYFLPCPSKQGGARGEFDRAKAEAKTNLQRWIDNIDTLSFESFADKHPCAESSASDLPNDCVEVKLCIGLSGVCILSLLGDDIDWVYDDIEQRGPSEWVAALPEHDKPIEGIYTICLRASVVNDALHYEILSTKTR